MHFYFRVCSVSKIEPFFYQRQQESSIICTAIRLLLMRKMAESKQTPVAKKLFSWRSNDMKSKFSVLSNHFSFVDLGNWASQIHPALFSISFPISSCCSLETFAKVNRLQKLITIIKPKLTPTLDFVIAGLSSKISCCLDAIAGRKCFKRPSCKSCTSIWANMGQYVAVFAL